MTPLYVAFLRGVGGSKPAPHAELRRCFTEHGHDLVTPVASTGNVVFGPGVNPDPPKEAAISAMLERHFGYPLRAIIMPGAEVTGLVRYPPAADRFDPSTMTRFIAILAEDAPPDDLDPRPVWDDGYVLCAMSGRDLCFFIDRKRDRAPHLMRRLDREFGRMVTTRTWSTLEKVAAALDAQA